MLTRMAQEVVISRHQQPEDPTAWTGSEGQDAVERGVGRRPRLFAVGPVSGCAPPRVALARQRRLELRFQEFFDEGPDAGADPGLQWVKPVRAELQFAPVEPATCDVKWLCHRVISPGAPTPVMAC